MDFPVNIHEFHILNNEEKNFVLDLKGVYLDGREDEDSRYELYQIDGFYAEKIFRLETNEYAGLRTYLGTNLLEKYLEKMDIKID